jgi:hypothetical protein
VVLKRIVFLCPGIDERCVFNGLLVAVYSVFEATSVNLYGVAHAPFRFVGGMVVSKRHRGGGDTSNPNQ